MGRYLLSHARLGRTSGAVWKRHGRTGLDICMRLSSELLVFVEAGTFSRESFPSRQDESHENRTVLARVLIVNRDRIVV